MFLKEISKEQIDKLEIRQFEGIIEVVDDLKKLKSALRELAGDDVLGFDTETKPAFRKGVKNELALIQISNREKCWLFRINKIGFSDGLRKLLEETSVRKVGVGLTDDLHKLRSMSEFHAGGFIELQKYVEAFNIESKSLKKITAIVMGFKISKAQQTSNWEAETLSDNQKRYAATDAWVCLEIYHRLRNSIPDFE